MTITTDKIQTAEQSIAETLTRVGIADADHAENIAKGIIACLDIDGFIVADTRRVQSALNTMPYGGSAYLGIGSISGMDAAQNAENLAKQLESLAETLRDVAAKNEKNEAELRQHQQARAALRWMLSSEDV